MRPILKWVGGKTRSLEELERVLPDHVHGYYEPFCGGAALFCRLATLGRFRRAYLSDQNTELITTYTAIRNDPERVVEELRRLTRKPIDRDAFYRLRASHVVAPAKVAARMIVLNKTCYKGLYRVNSRGEFNAPFGNYAKPEIFDAGHLREFAAILKNVTLIDDSYSWAIAAAEPGDFVYLDPPYLQHTESETHTAYHGYTSRGFDVAAHWRLAGMAATLTARGVDWAASNADTLLARRMFYGSGVRMRGVAVARTINGKPVEGTTAKELLIWHRADRAAKAAEG